MGERPPPSPAEQDAYFRDAVRITMGQWTAVQLAVENQWGGMRSRDKAVQLEGDIVTWFYQGKGDKYGDELEELLDEYLIENFNMEVDDGSVREVSNKLVEIYYECAEGDYSSVKDLQEKEKQPRAAVGSSRRAPGNDDDEEEDEDDDSDIEIDEDDSNGRAEGASMDTDMPSTGGNNEKSKSKSKARAVSEPSSSLTAEEEAEGWEMAPAKGRRGSRNKS